MLEHHGLGMFLTMLICCYKLSNIQVVICAQITGKPRDVKIFAGMEATFQCIVKLNRDVTDGPTYTVGWWSGGNMIANGSSILIQNNRYSIEQRTIDLTTDGKFVSSTLKITKVKHADAGKFTCSIIQKMEIQASAWLIVKPQCMPLPGSVTIKDNITLSCMLIGPGNYNARLTWYAGDHNDNKNTTQVILQAVNSYLNTTVAVKDYVNGTIFKCVAKDPKNRMMTETCSTNPLNIVENEPIFLDVEVHALSPLPLTAGNKACFECKVSCSNCVQLMEYTWAFNGSAIQSQTPKTNKICFISVLLSDNDQTVRCTTSFASQEGVGVLVLQVVATTNKAPSTIKPNNGINNHLENNDNTTFILIVIVVIIIIIFIILGLLLFYHKHKLGLRENVNETNKETHVNKTATQTESQNNQQQNSLSPDATQMYAKGQRVNNLKTDKQNVEKLVLPQSVEINFMYESLEMNNLAQEKSIEEDISDLYAKVDKPSKVNENVKRSPDVTHWQSPSGDVYACVQKNKASTLPANH